MAMPFVSAISPDMRRFLLFGLILAAAGCSNAPLAGTLDCVTSSKDRPGSSGPAAPAVRPAQPALPAPESLPPPDLVPPTSPRP
ncbi:MAG TPA: hypothetical protein VGL71_13025 [Urbifossiella sp.]